MHEQNKSTIIPGQRIPEYAKDSPCSIREQRKRCVGVQLFDLPHDVKVKDIAGFCKSEKIAESMAWNLHQPFNIQMGPIKIMQNYVLLLFVTVHGAQRAVTQLNRAYFKNRPVHAKISENQEDQAFIDQCFQLKDVPNFQPAYVIVMKQITLPSDNYEFGDVIEKTWNLPRPDYQRVRSDNGICFYKSAEQADFFFQQMRDRFFQQHVNDIFRMDID